MEIGLVLLTLQMPSFSCLFVYCNLLIEPLTNPHRLFVVLSETNSCLPQGSCLHQEDCRIRYDS